MARTTGDNRRKTGCPGENQEIRTGDLPATYRRPLPTDRRPALTTGGTTGENRRKAGCPGENQEIRTGDGPTADRRRVGR